MVLVHGSNSFGPTRPKDAVAFTVPCVWPEGWSVFVPRARPVRKGFLNLSEVTVVSLVESGLTWLGGMGSGDKGTPIVDFSGDMMHFDLRTQRRCGSADLDKWMDENDSIRKPMKGDITLAQAQIDLARASAENFFAGGNNANELAANTKAVQELGGAKTRAAAGVDDQLKALIEEAKQTWDKLQALRSKPFVPGGIYDGLCDRLDEAVVAVQYATDLDQVKKGNDSATDVRSLTTLTPIVKTPPASPALPTPEARVTLSDALAAIRSAEKVGVALSQKLVAASKTVAKAPAKNDAAINADLQVFKDTEEKAEQALTKAST